MTYLTPFLNFIKLFSWKIAKATIFIFIILGFLEASGRHYFNGFFIDEIENQKIFGMRILLFFTLEVVASILLSVVYKISFFFTKHERIKETVDEFANNLKEFNNHLRKEYDSILNSENKKKADEHQKKSRSCFTKSSRIYWIFKILMPKHRRARLYLREIQGYYFPEDEKKMLSGDPHVSIVEKNIYNNIYFLLISLLSTIPIFGSSHFWSSILMILICLIYIMLIPLVFICLFTITEKIYLSQYDSFPSGKVNAISEQAAIAKSERQIRTNEVRKKIKVVDKQTTESETD